MEKRNKINLTATCEVCNTTYEFPVYEKDFDRYIAHECNIQDAFPYLTPGQRELLISGLCDSCFEKSFK